MASFLHSRRSYRIESRVFFPWTVIFWPKMAQLVLLFFYDIFLPPNAAASFEPMSVELHQTFGGRSNDWATAPQHVKCLRYWLIDVLTDGTKVTAAAETSGLLPSFFVSDDLITFCQKPIFATEEEKELIGFNYPTHKKIGSAWNCLDGKTNRLRRLGEGWAGLCQTTRVCLEPVPKTP